MEITAARRKQTILFHKRGKVLSVLLVVRGIVEFHTVQTELFQAAEQYIESFIEKVFFGVRDGSETAVFLYEFNRLHGSKTFCLAIRLCTGFEISVKRVVDIVAIALFHHLTSHVHTSQTVRRKVNIEIDSEVFEFLAYANVSFFAHILNVLQILHEIGVFAVDIVS